MKIEELNILDIIDLEEAGENLFQSRNLLSHPQVLRPGVFGGQIVAQSLNAAYKTVTKEFKAHSLHAYFLLPALSEIPILYEVYRERDGKTYAARVVYARQNGRSVFTLMCSFTKIEKSEFNHQHTMPSVPSPDTFICEEERFKLTSEQAKCPPFHRYLLKDRFRNQIKPFEFRAIVSNTDEGLITPPIKASHRYFWLRSRKKLTDDTREHHCALAFASDEECLFTAGLPLGVAFVTDPHISMLTSLDHTLYFHEEFRADEWLLLELEAVKLKNARGYVLGRIYRQDGTLVASIVQEGIVRIKQGSMDKVLMQECKF
ncbi:uncharacterized protein VTP21DRAFT_4062 [Calcarisporiella thermophila]|uniref:uncharacterized protein n=1 Tax=Calcarisporiella thermophila TaxID=911321 RepID=UPI00374338A3